MNNNEIEQIKNSPNQSELFILDRKGTSVEFEDNELKGVNAEDFSGKGLRFIKDGKLCIVSGTKSVPLDTLFSMAEESVSHGIEAVFDFPESADVGSTEFVDNRKAEVDALTTPELVEMGRELVSLAKKRKPEYQISVKVEKNIERVHIVNSRGVDKSLETSNYDFEFSADRAEEGNIIGWFVGSNRIVPSSELEDFLDELFRFLDLAENPVSMDGGTYPVILHPRSLGYMLPALDAGLSGRSVFEGTSPLINKVGEKILDERFTLIDDPEWKGSSRYTTFDHEGIPVSRKKIFDKGVLKSYMTNLEYAARLKIPPTGNGYRRSFLLEQTSVGSPSISSSSRMIEPGSVDVDDMIADIDDGLLLVMSFDCWMGNLINGDFSGSVSMGFRIRKGRLVGRVKDMQISGNIYRFFGEKLVAISDSVLDDGSLEDRFPYIMVKDVTIS